MTWDEAKAHVTQSYEDWSLAETDIRAYLRLASRLASTAYGEAFEEVSQEASGDHFDIADVASMTEGLWPIDFEWMLLASVIKDAVTAFDVYLEKAREEVLGMRGLKLKPAERAPSFDELASFFRNVTGVEIKGHQDLDGVRHLRHLLTHRRGQLRTEDLRERFGGNTFNGMECEVDLTPEAIFAHMETLASHARRVDRGAYEAARDRG